MERSVELKFEAEVKEASKSVLRFQRTDTGWGPFKSFLFENFGKLVTNHLDLQKFSSKEKITISIKNISAANVGFEENNTSIVIRAVVNELFNTGMSFRLSQENTTRFFKKSFSTQECAELTESTVLLEGKNPYELGDILEIKIQKGGLTLKSPATHVLKAQAKMRKPKATSWNETRIFTAKE